LVLLLKPRIKNGKGHKEEKWPWANKKEKKRKEESDIVRTSEGMREYDSDKYEQ
jgi:hypothetical protein